MTLLVGLAAGAGLFLMWWSCWESAARPERPATIGRIEELLHRAGIEKVSPGALLASSAGAGVVILLLFVLLTRSLPIAVCFGIFGAAFPLALVRWQAKRRAASLRGLWPDAVDHLRSAIRAGLTLPEALIQLGYNGPAELRPAFIEFGSDYRAGGQFDLALERLKIRLSDPVADSLIVALRLTREVGGTDLGRLLGTLGDFLRDNARTRSELEARQSWTVNAARLAVAAPWIVLMLLASRPEAVAAYNSPAGAGVLLGGLGVSILCYQLMLRIGALPREERVMR